MPFEWSTGATLTTKVYGMYTFRGQGLKDIRHVITPNAGVTYRPDQSTQIYGPFGTNGATSSYSPYDIGIYGKPPEGESGAMNFGLIQNLEAKVRDKKERFVQRRVGKQLGETQLFLLAAGEMDRIE